MVKDRASQADTRVEEATPLVGDNKFPYFCVRNVEEFHKRTGFSNGGRSGGESGNVMGVAFHGGSVGA